MKLYILGTNTDNKGMQLEMLTTDMLNKQGYINISANVVSSGGSEVDAIAIQRQTIGTETIDTQIICECKAHNRPITINDWMKFIGKVHVEKMKNELTIGLFIALSGANGNVIGSYNDIKNRNCPFIKLMAGDDIIAFLTKEYSLAQASALESHIKKFTDKSISVINLAYYEKSIYWIIGFAVGGFTLLNKDANILKDKELKTILALLNENTEYIGYIDIEEENTAYNRRITIDKLTLSILMDSTRCLSLDEIFSINESLSSKNSDMAITKEEMEFTLNNNNYVIKSDNKYSLKHIEIEDLIEFYRYLFTGILPIRLLGRRMYTENINSTLLTKILEIQHNIKIPNEEECMFFLKYSPSALSYAIHPDQDLIRYRSSDGTTISDSVDRGHTEWFMQKIANLFVSDYYNQKLHEIYFNYFKINSLKIEQTFIITKDTDQTISINNNRSMLLAKLSGEYNNQIILVSELPK